MNHHFAGYLPIAAHVACIRQQPDTAAQSVLAHSPVRAKVLNASKARFTGFSVSCQSKMAVCFLSSAEWRQITLRSLLPNFEKR